MRESKGLNVSHVDVARVLDNAVLRVITRLQQKVVATAGNANSKLFVDFVDFLKEKVDGFVNESMRLYDQNFAFPIGTRFIDRCGPRVALVIEQPPMVRTLKINASVDMSDDVYYDRNRPRLPSEDLSVQTYQLALPYVIFVFFFIENDSGLMPYGRVKTAFRKKPLQSKSDLLYYSFLPNAHSQSMEICEGEVAADQIAKESGEDDDVFSISKYVDSFIRTYWHSSFGRDYRENFGVCQSEDPEHFSSLRKWEECSLEDSSFILRAGMNKAATIEDLFNLHKEVSVRGKNTAQVFRVAIENEIRKFSENFRSHLSIDVGGLSREDHEVAVVQEMMQEFLYSATNDLREFYENKVMVAVRGVEERIKGFSRQLLGEETSQQDDMTNPW